jgi:hypothetical protein
LKHFGVHFGMIAKSPMLRLVTHWVPAPFSNSSSKNKGFQLGRIIALLKFCLRLKQRKQNSVNAVVRRTASALEEAKALFDGWVHGREWS